MDRRDEARVDRRDEARVDWRDEVRGSARPVRRIPVKPALGLAALLLVAGLVISRPLALEWKDGLPLTARAPIDRAVLTRAPGDTLQLYYQLWLVRDGLTGPTPLFRDPYQFRVDGPRWNLPQTFLPLALPFALLSPLGDHAAYNLLVLLSFPLAGLAAYALARRYVGDGVGAVAAGLVFALVPARLGPLFGGHPAGFAAALVPVVLWGLDVAVVDGRVRGALAGGAALVGLAMLEPHYTYLVGSLAAAYVPARWLLAPSPRRLAARPLLAFLLLAAVGGAWLLMLRQVFLVGSIAEAGRSLAEVRLFSPGPAALRLPATYGGVMAAVLALVGLAMPGPRRRGLAALYGLVFAAGLVLSLGPTLSGVPLYQALHRWVPLFGLIRNPEKFRLLTSLGVAMLVGFGIRALWERLSRPAGRRAAAVLLVALVVETAPWHAIALTRFPAIPLYATLRDRAGLVLNLPLWPGDSAWSSVYLYTVTRTRAPMLNGYSPLVPRRYVTEVFEPLQSLNVGDLGPAEHALLRRLGVTHILLDRSLFPSEVSPFPSAYTRDRLRASPGLALVSAADPLWLYRVTESFPGDAPPATSPVGIFFEAEALFHETGVVEPDAAGSGGRVVAARAGATRPGFLTYGPYRLLPAGAYRARFRVRGAGLGVDVASDQGRRLLAHREPTPFAAWEEVELPFTLERAQVVEYRVRWDGRADAAVDWVAVVAADRPDPEWTFEVEDLPHQLGERPDSAASGGWAGYAHPLESLKRGLLSGPMRLYPPGRYHLALRARTDDPARGPVLRLTVTEPQGRLLAERTVDAADLPAGRYHEVGLDFRLTQPTVLEFPVIYLGGTGVYFDRLVVSPDRGTLPAPPRPLPPARSPS